MSTDEVLLHVPVGTVVYSDFVQSTVYTHIPMSIYRIGTIGSSMSNSNFKPFYDSVLL